MKFNPTKISDIKIGMLVEIKDLRTEKLIQGKNNGYYFTI